ncbi:MAG: hypothetical protein E5X89_32220 [Mesorhizobium sp.]|nr:hypothetical protein [Mesorhizobium sp.]TIO04703.1 MAG: hypothetical protein E5X88_30465 [Mesorhizobium sp.]TIO29096.1 MAG: hypothetical protein E5X89_32220 [Mesorhizobium sp.]TIP10877.1 MAG: hypothetical protein E5X73_20945 [Mesorhizobium sp.]
MTGVSLSRWTMSYFAAALAALLLAEGLMAAGYGYPSASIESPRTLIVVHIVTIGWLSLLMCGALFQFVPVLIHRPLFNNVLTMPALLCLLSGLVALLSGFLWLDGQIEDALPFFPIAAILLGAGFALVIWNLARTLMSGWPLPLPARFVGVGLVGICLTTALGTIFALVRGGVTDNAYLIDLAGRGVSLHALAGLAGWLTLCAIGVSYRLFAMFMLTPELDRRGTRLVLHLAICALVIAVPGGVLAILSEGSLNPVLLAAGTVGLAALGLYGRDMLYLYRARKRRMIELNTRMAVLAFASLGLTILLTAILAGSGALERHVAVVVFLAAFGWLSGLGLAMLYKIVPFLTWLECYGPVLGKKATPRVQDLVVENRAEKWFLLYFASVWGGAAALLYEHSPTFQASAAGMLVATAGIIVQLLRARRLVDVSAEARFPEGAHRPGLLYSFAQRA